ncbi:MAG: putative metal-binding motif-containing protein [Myxococcota bacterium]
MSNRNLLASLVLILAAGGLWAGCTVGFSAEEDGIFTCESNDDCLEDYECGDTGYCKPTGQPDPAPDCDNSEGGIDQDGDGYGTGDDRSKCQFDERDCNDDDPDIYPGAPELCDGKVNDCNDGAADEVEVFSCSSEDDCPDLADVPEGVISEANYRSKSCEGGTCVYLPLNTAKCSVDDSVVKLTCASGTTGYSWVRDASKSYTDLPAECRGL